MSNSNWGSPVECYEGRWELVIPGEAEKTLQFSVDLFIRLANQAIKERGCFAVALSGGGTPQAIFQELSSAVYREKIDWSKVLLFWSDERCVPQDHPDSNYRMAMEAGFGSLPLCAEHIFPLLGTGNLEQNARDYEELILKKIPSQKFDLVMLGMGEDGHTASLFPKTHALNTAGQLVIPNYLPHKGIWRMTLTFPCILTARHTVIYVLGKAKAEKLKEVLTGPYVPDLLPVQNVGTIENPALWIVDEEAASQLN
jgi:6-phosphogluconolactonase